MDPLPRTDSPFSFANIHDSVQDAIRALPADAKGGLFIDGTIERHGLPAARIVLVQKVGDHFAIATEGTWHGHHASGKVMGEILWGN